MLSLWLKHLVSLICPNMQKKSLYHVYPISKSPLDWWLNHLTLATGLVWSFQNLLWTVPKMLSQWPFMYGCTRPGVSVDRTVQCLFQNQGNSPCFDSEIVYWAEDACLWVFTLPWISFSCSFCTWPFFCHGNCALALSSPKSSLRSCYLSCEPNFESWSHHVVCLFGKLGIANIGVKRAGMQSQLHCRC